MSENLDTASSSDGQVRAQQLALSELKDLHVRIPLEAWRRGRIAALNCRLPFKVYLAGLLMKGGPTEPDDTAR
ncbi:MAG TPA: hypothetical protein VG713_08620 [Pirellulales bacterium]|nr:hypothetical protein [Pirellulales bacterium]